MDDTFFVGRRQAASDLDRDFDGLAHRQAARAQPFLQRLAFQKFGNDVRSTLVRADVEDCQDVGMVELAGSACLLFETAQAVRIRCKFGRQHLDRHVATESRVARPVHFTHAPRT